MAVTRIGAPLERDMLAVLDELTTKARRGEIQALAVMVEMDGKSTPMTFVKGRYRSDPFRCLTAFERMKFQLHRACDRGEEAA